MRAIRTSIEGNNELFDIGSKLDVYDHGHGTYQLMLTKQTRRTIRQNASRRGVDYEDISYHWHGALFFKSTMCRFLRTLPMSIIKMTPSDDCRWYEKSHSLLFDAYKDFNYCLLVLTDRTIHSLEILESRDAFIHGNHEKYLNEYIRFEDFVEVHLETNMDASAILNPNPIIHQ